jgi:hypothetical protein
MTRRTDFHLALGFLVAVVSLSFPVPARIEVETVFTVDGARQNDQ